MDMNVFKGSDDYVVTKELMNAVNVSIALQKPLLIKGEPGTGKTMLAESISKALDMDHLGHQIHDEGTGRTLCVRYCAETVRQPVWRGKCF